MRLDEGADPGPMEGRPGGGDDAPVIRSGREGLDLLEPDRRDRGDRLVHGVERSEAQDDVADRATDEDGDQQEDGEFQPAPMAHSTNLRAGRARPRQRCPSPTPVGRNRRIVDR